MPSKKKRIKNRLIFLILLGTAFLVAFFIKENFIRSFHIASEVGIEDIKSGDNVLVSKRGCLETGDIVLYYNPLQEKEPHIFLGRINKLPGEKIYIHGKEMRLPQKNRYAKIDSITAPYYYEAIQHEGKISPTVTDSGLFWDGKIQSFYMFEEDYYWIEMDDKIRGTDSRHLGIIPKSKIIGKVFNIWYSPSQHRWMKSIK